MRTRRWLAVILWVALIYTAIPFVQDFRAAFVARWPAELLAFAVMGIVAAAAAGALVSARRLRGRLDSADLAWLTGCALVLIVWTRDLMRQPEEAFHFVEYGILGVLLYRALRPAINDVGVFATAALLGSIIGTVDEIIQWAVPGRFWDFRDLVLNGGASILVQIAVWRLVAKTASRPTPRTTRILCRLATAELLILMICLAATPQRLDALATRFPPLRPLADNGDVMSEYGFLHRLDATTLFRSRLTRNELADQDRRRSAEAAAALDRADGRYGEFLRTVLPIRDPFTYEARVHIFARDRSLAEAERHDVGSRAYRRSMTDAARENEILEGVFRTTLDRSMFLWPEHRRLTVTAAQNPTERYVSRVSAHLITRVTEHRLRTLMLVVVILLLAVDIALGRQVSPPQPPEGPG